MSQKKIVSNVQVLIFLPTKAMIKMKSKKAEDTKTMMKLIKTDNANNKNRR